MSPRPVALRRVRLLAAVVAVAGLMAGSSRAKAESISLYIDKTTGTAPVSVSMNGGTSSSSITPGPYYWHQVGSPINSNFPSNVATFCVELNQGFPTPSTSYTVDALGAKVSAAAATAITKLWGAYYNTAWESTSFTGSTNSTAFQLALWELVYDGPGSTLTSGTFRYTGASSSASTLAASWLAGLGSLTDTFATNFAGKQIVWLSSGSFQDQITLKNTPTPPKVVPAPPSVVLAGFALLTGLCGRAARRRKEIADAVK